MLACLSCSGDSLSRYQLSLFQSSKLRFDSQEALCFLGKCTDFRQLKQVHAKMIRHGLVQDELLFRKLLCLCSSYREMDYAILAFHQLNSPLTFTWNLVIRALTSKGAGGAREALLLYNLMICDGIPPDKVTFPFVIKACLCSSTVDKGKEVHGLAIKSGFSSDIFVQNTLMDLYFKCGHVKCGCKVFERMRVRNVVSWTTMVTGLVDCGQLESARRIFHKMPTRNVVSWSSLINGYVINQQPEEAFELFHRMQVDSVRPNEFTVVSLLKACTQLGSLSMGRRIHDFALKNGCRIGIFVGTTLVDMYSKCGSLQDAREVFDVMQNKSLATWNSMITSLGVHGCGIEALALFEQMEKENVQPDAITFVGVLCACARTKNVKEGFRYFQLMTETYGIQPICKHWVCMTEICNHVNILDDVSNLKPDMLVYLNRTTEVDSVAKVEKGLSCCSDLSKEGLQRLISGFG